MTWRPRIPGSLFAKIYLTLVASLIVVALTSAVFIRAGSERSDRGWIERRNAFIVQMLPADEPRRERQRTLERLGAALDADITLFGPDRRRLQSAGRPIPPGAIDKAGWRGRSEGDDVYAAQLPDGRIAAVRPRSPFDFGPRTPILWLLSIALVTALAAYPVVRHLTRRLERLRHAADAWGAGSLDARADVAGSDEIARVATSFNAAADKVERQIEAHRALLANASHELRSPLARLRMAVDLFAQDGARDRQAEIERNLEELDALVEEILLASRLEHGDGRDAFQDLELLSMASEEASRHDLEVEGSLAPIRGDPRLINRLIRNLIQNAAKHGRPPIEITVTTLKDRAVLRVRDHGPGVPADEVERLFEPFYRPKGRSESIGGWGLGLSLVRQIAEHHQGTVTASNAGDGGAVFEVSLPSAV